MPPVVRRLLLACLTIELLASGQIGRLFLLANKASLTTKLFRLLTQAIMRRSCESSLDCSRAQLIDDLTIIMTKPLRESILQSSHLTKNLVNSFWDSSMHAIEYSKSFVFDHSP